FSSLAPQIRVVSRFNSAAEAVDVNKRDRNATRHNHDTGRLLKNTTGLIVHPLPDRARWIPRRPSLSLARGRLSSCPKRNERNKSQCAPRGFPSRNRGPPAF